jgi:hypothetical protein
MRCIAGNLGVLRRWRFSEIGLSSIVESFLSNSPHGFAK